MKPATICLAVLLFVLPGAMADSGHHIALFGLSTSHEAHLTWTAVAGADIYRIYRATNAKGPWRLVTISNKATATDSKKLEPGKTYFYRVISVVVKTVSDGTESGSSDVLALRIPTS